VSHTYGLYLGSRLARGLEAYLDLEAAKGQGISHVTGLAGITNGDVIRQGSADLGTGPYLARAFVRYVVGFGSKATERFERSQDQLGGTVPASRLEFTVGKLAASDLFDARSFAWAWTTLSSAYFISRGIAKASRVLEH